MANLDSSIEEKVAELAGAVAAIDVIYDAYPDFNEGMKTIIENSLDIEAQADITITEFGDYKSATLNNYYIELDCDYPELYGEIFQEAEYAARETVEQFVDDLNNGGGTVFNAIIDLIYRFT